VCLLDILHQHSSAYHHAQASAFRIVSFNSSRSRQTRRVNATDCGCLVSRWSELRACIRPATSVLAYADPPGDTCPSTLSPIIQPNSPLSAGSSLTAQAGQRLLTLVVAIFSASSLLSHQPKSPIVSILFVEPDLQTKMPSHAPIQQVHPTLRFADPQRIWGAVRSNPGCEYIVPPKRTGPASTPRMGFRLLTPRSGTIRDIINS